MIRMFLFGCLISGLTATASAEKYILRIDTIRYIDQPETDQAAKGKMLRRIEVLVEPNKPFHVKTQAGQETIGISGQFASPEEDDATRDFRIKVQYRYALYTGRIVVINGKEVKEANHTRIMTTQLDIDIGKPVELGRAGDTAARLVLNKYDPRAEK